MLYLPGGVAYHVYKTNDIKFRAATVISLAENYR